MTEAPPVLAWAGGTLDGIRNAWGIHPAGPGQTRAYLLLAASAPAFPGRIGFEARGQPRGILRITLRPPF